MMKKIILILLVITIWSPHFSYAEVKCRNYIHLPNNLYKLSNPFNKLMYGIPGYASRINRKVEHVDYELMSLSYQNLDRGQPREYGLIKLLNRKREIIAQSKFIAGIQGSINLNTAIDLLLERNVHVKSQAVSIEITHTHPKSYADSSMRDINHHHFSEADFFQDKKLFDSLSKSSMWSHLNVESYIVFLNSNITGVPTGSPLIAFFNSISLRGYLIERQ
jgi:hypothetical protein